MSILNINVEEYQDIENFKQDLIQVINYFIQASDSEDQKSTVSILTMVEMLETTDILLNEFRDCINWHEGQLLYRGKNGNRYTWTFIKDNIRQTLLKQFAYPTSLATGKEVESVNIMIRQFIDLVVMKVVDCFLNSHPGDYDCYLVNCLIDHLYNNAPEVKHHDDSFVAKYMISKTQEDLIKKQKTPLTTNERLQYIHEAVMKNK